MLNNWVNFQFSIVTKSWELAHENLVNTQGTGKSLSGIAFMLQLRISQSRSLPIGIVERHQLGQLQ
jgi:hypothetical protein